MTTLLYGEKPEADVAPGNRADAEDDPGASGAHPRLLPTIELRAVAPPFYPEPSPWVAPPPVALPFLMLGLAAIAAVFVGLALMAVPLAWSTTIFTRLALCALGGYLVALGIAIVMSVHPPRL